MWTQMALKKIIIITTIIETSLITIKFRWKNQMEKQANKERIQIVKIKTISSNLNRKNRFNNNNSSKVHRITRFSRNNLDNQVKNFKKTKKVSLLNFLKRVEINQVQMSCEDLRLLDHLGNQGSKISKQKYKILSKVYLIWEIKLLKWISLKNWNGLHNKKHLWIIWLLIWGSSSHLHQDHLQMLQSKRLALLRRS